MTVAELIAILQKAPPNSKVVHEVNTGFAEESSFLPIEKAHLIQQPREYTDQVEGDFLLE